MTELNVDKEENYVYSLNKETHKAICDALLIKRDILEMRTKEAHEAEAEGDFNEAMDELLVVNHALEQLHYKGEKE